MDSAVSAPRFVFVRCALCAHDDDGGKCSATAISTVRIYAPCVWNGMPSAPGNQRPCTALPPLLSAHCHPERRPALDYDRGIASQSGDEGWPHAKTGTGTVSGLHCSRDGCNEGNAIPKTGTRLYVGNNSHSDFPFAVGIPNERIESTGLSRFPRLRLMVQKD